MGNVLASNSPPQKGVPAPPLSVPIPTAPVQPAVDAAADPSQEIRSPDRSSETNPGSLEDLHKKCKETFPTNFEGAKVVVSKGLSNHFQISHTLNMSSITPPGYRFGTTFVGTNVHSPSEAYPVLLGDIDPSGNLNANVIHQFRNIRCKFGTQIQNSKFTATQMSADYRGKDYTASLTVGNPDLVSESGVFVAQYLQKVASKVDLGAEIVYQVGHQLPGKQFAVVSFAGRYTGSNYVASGTIGGAGFHLCYYHKASEQLQVGVEVDTNMRAQESVASFGYQVDLPKANLVFRGMVDSNWTVGAVLEKKLQPLPFTFALSGLVNHPKNQFRFGIGLFIG